MVSKTFVCLALLALVGVCYCGPTERRNQNQRPCDGSSQNDSNSDESSQQPCDLIQQQQQNHSQNKKNIRVQDTSSFESNEHQRRVNIRMSQEENQAKEIRFAPKHERIQGSHNNYHYKQTQETKPNEQRSRHRNLEIESMDNVSQNKQN